MKVLKDMSKNGRWIGECQKCFSILVAEGQEIDTYHMVVYGYSVPWKPCPACQCSAKSVYFYPEKSEMAVKLLEKTDIDDF